METVSERAKELAEKFSKVRYVFPPEEVTARGFTVETFQRVSEIVEKEIKRYTLANLPKLIEQALLAERRLAMEEAAKIATMRVKHQPYENCRECELVRDVIIDLRAAAEKEVGK